MKHKPADVREVKVTYKGSRVSTLEPVSKTAQLMIDRESKLPPSKDEQDAIIADMLKAQGNLLRKNDSKAARRRQAKEDKRQARIEAEAKATAETATYHPHRPAPARRVESQTTVTAAPVERKGSTVQRTVEVRTGQSDFRNRVSMNFGGSCAITGHNVTQCLQAAHISPFADDKNNNTSNGILMSADLHLLFDNHLMSINPDTLTVHFKCNHPYAGLYEGNELKAHRVKLDVEALRIHWNLFKG